MIYNKNVPEKDRESKRLADKVIRQLRFTNLPESLLMAYCGIDDVATLRSAIEYIEANTNYNVVKGRDSLLNLVRKQATSRKANDKSISGNNHSGHFETPEKWGYLSQNGRRRWESKDVNENKIEYRSEER